VAEEKRWTTGHMYMNKRNTRINLPWIGRVRFLALWATRAGHANRSLSATRFGNEPAELGG